MVSSGTILKTRPAFFWGSAEMIREGRQRHAVVHRVPHEPVRASPDRRERLRPPPVRYDPHHEVYRKRSERLLQREAHRVSVHWIDRCQQPVRAFPRRHEIGIEKAAERMDDVCRRQLVSIVEAHALPESCDVCQWIRVVDGLGQIGHHPQLIVDTQKTVVEQLVQLLRRFIRSDPRVEIRRRVHQRDRDRSGRWGGARAAPGQEHAEERGLQAPH
jgi:hypothetical protein